MTSPIDIILAFKKTGRGDKEAAQALKDIERHAAGAERSSDRLARTSSRTGTSLSGVATKALAYGAAIGGAALAAERAYKIIGEGAALEKAQFQFERLSESIDTTANSLLGNLRAATSGMVSDAELISGATDIINLGLGKSEEEVVRLATAISTLGLDMQQVILTFANNSKARLDALGLSVEGVTKKAEELEAQGFEGDAFDEAVLIGLEEKMELLGDTSDTTAGKMAQLEADWANLSNQGKQLAATIAGPVVGALADLASGGEAVETMFDQANEIAKTSATLDEYIDKLREAGVHFPDRSVAEAWFIQGSAQANAAREAARYTDFLERQAAVVAGPVSDANEQVVSWSEQAKIAYEQAGGGVLTYKGALEQLAAAEAEATQQSVQAFRSAGSLAEELLTAQDDLVASQGDWVQSTRDTSGRVAAISGKLAADLTQDQVAAYRDIVNTVEEGSAEWLNAYNALQNDLSQSQRESLVAQMAELQAANGQAISFYTGDAEAAEEARERIIAAQAAIQESYRNTGFEALLAGAQTSEAFAQALEAGVSIGALSQEQADLQQRIGGTNLKILELNEKLSGGAVSTDTYAAAFRALTGDMDLTTEAAIRQAEAAQDVVTALEEGGGSGLTQHYQDMADAAKDTADEIESDAITPQVDTSEALTAVGNLKSALIDIEGEYTATVRINQSGVPTAPPQTSNPGGGGFAEGGFIGGGAPVSGHGADNVMIAAQTGEFMLKRAAVNSLGLSRLNYINSTGRLPGFADGGLVGGGINSNVNAPLSITVNADRDAAAIARAVREAGQEVATGVRHATTDGLVQVGGL